MKKKRIAIIGATGFTGSELVRILINHPGAEIACITSESRAGALFSDVHPFFEGYVDIRLVSVEATSDVDIDLAFLALPHGISMDYVKHFRGSGFPVIDLSGDFRLNHVETYEAWYQKTHTFPEGITEAVYGIPELYRKKIENAQLVANPGCYPTSILLGIAPLISAGMVDPNSIIADSKSGVTGAGVKAKPVNHFSGVHDNFKAYGLKSHRHTIEIQEKLEDLSGGKVSVQFTPHLLPVDRGILSTIYLKPHEERFDEKKLHEVYETYYENAPFIRLTDAIPSVKNVRGTNLCDIYKTFDPRTNNIIVLSAIDNLVKGAAGQAVQNMNLIFGWNEDTGLHQIPLYP